MDYNPKTKPLSTLVREISKGKYDFECQYQREEGQWNRYKRSLLIDSLLRSIPLDPTRVRLKDDGIMEVFDGKQRMTTIRDYFDNQFALSKELEPVKIDGVSYDIAGKKFKKLDEEVQAQLKTCSLVVYVFTNCTIADVKEMFARQNSGVKLNNRQLRVLAMSDELNQTLYSLTHLSYADKFFTPAQRKNATDRDCLLQTLMLIETTPEHNYTSFRSGDMDKFAAMYSDHMDTGKLTVLEDALKSLSDAFENETEKIRIKSSTIPFVLYGAYKVKRDKSVGFAKYFAMVKDFLQTYDQNEKYTDLLQSKTSSSESVQARLDYWKAQIKAL